MSGHRGVLAAVGLLLLAAVPACGFADDNYDNAQAELDRSRPNLTVPQTVTTMKPYQTIPEDLTADSIPVELATPEQRAAALADAQRRADDRKAGRVPGSGAGTAAGRGPGATPTSTTTSTIPNSPACRASRSVQETGVLLVLSKRSSPTDYRNAMLAVGSSFRTLAMVIPAEQRAVALEVVAAYAPVEARAATATSTAAMKADLGAFLAAQSRNVTVVLKAASVLCPEVITENTDQAEKVQVDS